VAVVGDVVGRGTVVVRAIGDDIPGDVRRITAQATKDVDKSLADAFRRLDIQLGRANSNLNSLNRETQKFFHSWKTLPSGLRRFTFYTGLFAELGTEIATLGSAGGAGLLVLGSAATSAALGLGSMVAIFAGLTSDIDALPASVQPAARAVVELGGAFRELRDALRVRALSDTADAFLSMRDTVRALIPAFDGLADVIGGLIRDFASGIAPGTENFQNLYKVIQRAAPIFDRLVRAVGLFGSTLLRIFASDGANRAVEEFVGWIETLFERFDEFSKSPALDTWFRNASQIFGAVGRLLDATGTALNNLVTQDTVDQLVALLDNLADFMPALEGILGILGELDLFGLIAEALNVFGEAVEPLIEPLKDLASAVSDILSSGIRILGPIIEDVARALAPFVQGLADLMAEDPDGIAESILAIAGAFLVLKGASGLAGVAAMLAGVVTNLRNLRAQTRTPISVKITAAFSGFAGGIIGSEFADQLIKDPGWNELGGVIGGTLGGAIVGAMTGGLPGLLIGALAGMIAGQDWGFIWDAIFGDAAGEEALAKALGTMNIPAMIAVIIRSFATDSGIQSAWTEFWGGIGGEAAWGGLVEGFNGFLTWWNTLGPGAFFRDLVTNAATGWAMFVGWWQTGPGAFFAGLAAGFQQFMAPILTFWTQLWTSLTTVGGQFVGLLVQLWSGLWANLTAIFGPFIQGIVSRWQGFIGDFIGRYQAFVGDLMGRWQAFWGSLMGVITPVLARIAEGWRGFWSGLVGMWNGFFGTLGSMWNGFWSGLGGIIGGVWAGIVSTVSGAVSTIIGVINGMISVINGALAAIRNLTGGLVNLNIPSLPGLASGGLVFGPQRRLIGEAGPEAVVPLNRPLSQVDPAVRGLSAIAQGKGSMASGGVVGTGRVVNVEPGAIVIQTVADPMQIANMTLDRLVAAAAV
jgi:phage-related protein